MICQRCHEPKPLTYRSHVLGLRSICGPCIRTFNGWVRNNPLSRWEFFEQGQWHGFITDEFIRRGSPGIVRQQVLKRFHSLPPPLREPEEHHEWP